MEIEYNPYSKISVRSFMEHESPEKFATMLGTGLASNVSASGILKWANGVLFSVANFQPSDSIAKEYISGHLMFDHVDFALMPGYRSEINIPDKPLFKIGVLDLSNHTTFKLFAAWIKDNLAGKTGTSPKSLK